MTEKGETPEGVCTQQRRFPYGTEAMFRTVVTFFVSNFRSVNAGDKAQSAFSVTQIPSPFLCLGFHGDVLHKPKT
jgi:hypothetical protein